VLDWFGAEATIPELIQKKKYDKAERLLRKEFEAGRRDAELRLQLADVIALAGRSAEALPIYSGLADELARGGHAARAIAVLKKMERAAPGRSDVAERLASLIGTTAEPAAGRKPVPAEQPAAVAEEELFAGLEPVAAGDFFAAPEQTASPERVVEAEAVAVPEASLESFAPATDASSTAGPTAAAGLGPAFASPLFGEFSREDLLAVIRGLRFLSFEPGDIVVGDGEPGDSLLVISSGRVKAYVKGPAGRYAEAREMGEGDFFGEVALLYGRPRTATVTAVESCELLELERGMVESLAATRPRVREVLESFCRARVGA
jgi:cyclic nucleotide-binding protein